MVSDRQRWLVAVFEDESVARDAARKARQTGVDPDVIRIGDPIDALTSFRGEMREEVNVVAASVSPAGTTIALPLAASAGTTLAVPDTDPARHVLLRAGSVRIDVVGSDGRPIDTLKARRPRTISRHGARHARPAHRFR
jgi:hypothetical protein